MESKINDNTIIDDIPNFEIMREYPFVRSGMTYGEYVEEKEYYGEHWKEVRTGKYKPLWKQREEEDNG